MFTIRHVEVSGHESLRNAIMVWRETRAEGCVDQDRPLFADVGEEHPLAFATGKVFVMNAAGKTVAVYYFPDSAAETPTPTYMQGSKQRALHADTDAS